MELRYELWRSLGQNDVFLDYHSVTRKVRSLFRCDIDQIRHVLTDHALAVLIKGVWKPERAAVRQRTKASIKVIKPWINQLHRNGETTKHFCYGTMRLNVGTKFVTAKEHLTAEQRIAFALEVKLLWQPIDFVAALLHPFGKERLLTGAFFVAEI